MPMVHACGSHDCDVLTMGAYCVQHEQQHDKALMRLRLRHLVTASVVVVAAAAGALIRIRTLR